MSSTGTSTRVLPIERPERGTRCHVNNRVESVRLRRLIREVKLDGAADERRDEALSVDDLVTFDEVTAPDESGLHELVHTLSLPRRVRAVKHRTRYQVKQFANRGDDRERVVIAEVHADICRHDEVTGVRFCRVVLFRESR